jgi:hypothetical protein
MVNRSLPRFLLRENFAGLLATMTGFFGLARPARLIK